MYRKETQLYYYAKSDLAIIEKRMNTNGTLSQEISIPLLQQLVFNEGTMDCLIGSHALKKKRFQLNDSFVVALFCFIFLYLFPLVTKTCFNQSAVLLKFLGPRRIKQPGVGRLKRADLAFEGSLFGEIDRRLVDDLHVPGVNHGYVVLWKSNRGRWGQGKIEQLGGAG